MTRPQHGAFASQDDGMTLLDLKEMGIEAEACGLGGALAAPHEEEYIWVGEVLYSEYVDIIVLGGGSSSV